MSGAIILSDAHFAKVRQFLVEHALPFWASVGRYDNGCFVEHLDLSGNPVDPGYTRTRVQARQLYVFSHAHHTGLIDASDICPTSVDFLIGSAWLGDSEGWARRIDRQGVVLDPRFDFYDVSFALFALGWYYRISGDARCLDLAHRTLDFLEREAAHPTGGFFNDWTRSLPRAQNPHMHFVEALNVWYESTGEDRFADHAEQILQLFERSFVDPQTGALFEFFEDDWSRLNGESGQIVEPGHQFEWAWIIGHNGRLTGRNRHPLMRRLLNSALNAGYDARTGTTIDQVNGAGAMLSDNRRLWPQTEAIKAALAEAEFLGEDTSQRIASILSLLFERFLDPGPVPGTWIDHYCAKWTPLVDKVPASSLYHITLAFMELLRLGTAGAGGPAPSDMVRP